MPICKDKTKSRLSPLIKKQIVEKLMPLKPEKNILFGSYAYGKPTKNSDLDAMIIEKNYKNKWKYIAKTKQNIKKVKSQTLTPSTILDKIKKIKPKYEKEGLILIGLFGSYAKNKATKDSDIDLLYDIDSKEFCKKNPGFKAFSRLNEIKKELKEFFGKEVDLATIDNHNETFKKFALKGAIYVK